MESVFRSVKRVCYAGLDSVTLRREVAARVAPAVAYEAYAFSTTDPDTALMTHVVAHGVPDLLVRDYTGRLYPQECARLAMDLARQRTPVFCMAEQSPAMADAQHASGIRYDLNVVLAAGGRMWGSWCLMREAGAPSTTSRERGFLLRLAPHLARGLQSAALLERARYATNNGDEDESSPGVIVLDARNRPTLRTPAVTAWLDDLADVGVDLPDGIPLSVLTMVSRLRAAPCDVPEGISVRARGRSGRWYMLRATLSEPDASGSCAVVVVVRPAVPREVARLLTQLYDLSPREREIVAAVARGESTKAIAAQLAVSPHTVAEHIGRACDKIGVRGRKALIAKLFFDGYAPPFARSTAAAPRAQSSPS